MALVHDTEKKMHRKETITFLKGWPALSLLPVNRLQKSIASVFDDSSSILAGLCYGPDPGYEPLRVALATWLSEYYAACKPDASRFVITGGASQNLACLLQVYTDPTFTRSAFIVSPAYMLAFRIFEDNGLGKKMVQILEDDEGVDIEYLERIVQSRNVQYNTGDDQTVKPPRSYSKYYRHILYCVPTFSNPSGNVMSLKRRVDLVRIARQYDILLISDDVYDHLHWQVSEEGHGQLSEGQSSPSDTHKSLLPRLVDIDRTMCDGPSRFGNTVSNGSFSKICGPGVRCGWAEGTQSFARGLASTGSTRSGGAPSHLTSTYLTDMIVSGSLQMHISQTLLPSYKKRCAAMLKAIQEILFPLGVSMRPLERGSVAGGFFIWCKLPGSVSAVEFAQECSEEEVVIAPGNIFQVPGQDKSDFDQYFRLCFSWIDEGLIEVGIRRMAVVLENMKTKTANRGQDGRAM